MASIGQTLVYGQIISVRPPFVQPDIPVSPPVATITKVGFSFGDSTAPEGSSETGSSGTISEEDDEAFSLPSFSWSFANPFACCAMAPCGSRSNMRKIHNPRRPSPIGSPSSCAAVGESDTESSSSGAPVISDACSTSDDGSQRSSFGVPVISDSRSTSDDGNQRLNAIHPAAPDDTLFQSSGDSQSDQTLARGMTSITPTVPRSILAETVQKFEVGHAGRTDTDSGRILDMDRNHLVRGLTAFANVLDALGGGMGSYLLVNIHKLEVAKASTTIANYRDWIVSEVGVHASTGYKYYADDSAFMANLWIWWSLEFFVELFAQLQEGRETKTAVDEAYKQTLYHHHNFIQRAAFAAAVRQLPCRKKLFNVLRGSEVVQMADAWHDICEFVCLGRKVVDFLREVNSVCDQRLQEERKAAARR